MMHIFPVILDTSFLVSFFHKDDSKHNDALALMKSLSKIILLDYVIAETSTVLKNKVSIKHAQDFLLWLEKVDDIQIIFTHEDIFHDTLKYMNMKNKLSFVDTLLFITWKNMNISILTFDKELQKYLD